MRDVGARLSLSLSHSLSHTHTHIATGYKIATSGDTFKIVHNHKTYHVNIAERTIMGVKRAIYNQVSSGDRPEHQQLYTKDGLKELNDDTQLKKLIECEDPVVIVWKPRNCMRCGT